MKQYEFVISLDGSSDDRESFCYTYLLSAESAVDAIRNVRNRLKEVF